MTLGTGGTSKKRSRLLKNLAPGKGPTRGSKRRRGRKVRRKCLRQQKSLQRGKKRSKKGRTHGHLCDGKGAKRALISEKKRERDKKKENVKIWNWARKRSHPYSFDEFGGGRNLKKKKVVW